MSNKSSSALSPRYERLLRGAGPSRTARNPLKSFGEPAGTRTQDHLIKSQVNLVSTCFRSFPQIAVSVNRRKKPAKHRRFFLPLVSERFRAYDRVLLTRRLPDNRRPMRVKLTPAFVLTAPPPQKGDRVVYWDTAKPSFGLMVTKNGARS